MSILMTEYDYATDMAVLKEEAYEDGREEGISIGLERGAYQTKLKTARSMLEDGFPVSTASKYTNLPLEVVEQLAGDSQSPHKKPPAEL